MRECEEHNMEELFSKNIAINNSEEQTIDHGQGLAIGIFGSYKLYIKSISLNDQDRYQYKR